LPFDALFVPDELRAAVDDDAWLRAMLTAERALAGAQSLQVGDDAFTVEGLDVGELAREGRRAGNPVEPLVRRLRERSEHVHHGATSQDVLDTAAALVARDATTIILGELDGVAAACAELADQHRATVTAARTLLQQAVPTTFGLKAASWLVGVVHARERLAAARLPAQLGGAGGTLAALGDTGIAVLSAYAKELDLPEPVVPWHTRRLPLAELGATLAVAAGFCGKIALDLELLAQTEVGEVQFPADGRSSTMPHKRNPVGPVLTRACAEHVRAAAGVLLHLEHEHERAAGAWHAEWKALSDALAYTGGAAASLRETLDGLEVDVDRMRSNVRAEALSEAERRAGSARAGGHLGPADVCRPRARVLSPMRPSSSPGHSVRRARCGGAGRCAPGFDVDVSTTRHDSQP
jgi:3-carboxy-cis,cis-muconate cycloisomerase